MSDLNFDSKVGIPETAMTVDTGTSGQVLTSNGAGSAPTYQNASGGGLRYIVSDLWGDTSDYTRAGSGTGSDSMDASGLFINTGATATSHRVVEKSTGYGPEATTLLSTGNPAISIPFQVRTPVPTTGTFYFGVGSVVVSGSGHTFNTRHHFGFKIVYSSGVATLSATNANASIETATDITSGITVTNRNLYTAYRNGSQIEFYVNGTLKATHTTNLPTGSSSSRLVFISLSNDGAANNVEANIGPWCFQRDAI